MFLHPQGRVMTGDSALDTGVRGIVLRDGPGGAALYTASGPGGGVAAYALRAGGTVAELRDTAHYPAGAAARLAATPAAAPLDGEAGLVVGGGPGGLLGYALTGRARLGDVVQSDPLAPGTGGIGAVSAAGGVLHVADRGRGAITAYTAGRDGLRARPGPDAGEVTDLAVIDHDGTRHLLAADAAAQTVTRYAVAPGTGALEEQAATGAPYGLGVNAPVAIGTATAHDAAWAVVAATGSASLSVLRLAGDGALVPADHVVDTRVTRFDAVRALEVVEAGERVFVIAGGGDDGLSLFTLLPDGRLVHLDSHTDGAGLAGVSALAAAPVGGAIQVFAAAQGAPGLAQLSVPLPDGAVIRGSGRLQGTGGDDMIVAEAAGTTLTGGAGDDILVAGAGHSVLRGGAGADIFVLRGGAATARIEDFAPGVDRLDLSGLEMLRSPGQITVTPTDRGARLSYRDTDIRLVSEEGGPLSAGDIFGAHLPTPDRVMAGISRELLDDGDDAAGGDPGAPLSPGAGPVALSGTVRDGGGAPLADAAVTFTPEGDPAPAHGMTTGADGAFALGLAAGTAGRLGAVRPHVADDPAITAGDALEVLRLAVGLAPSWGPATGTAGMAADLDRSGEVTAADALEVLRAAVGLDADHPPRWIFTAGEEPQAGADAGIALTGLQDDLTLDLHGVLLGNMDSPA